MSEVVAYLGYIVGAFGLLALGAAYLIYRNAKKQ